MSPAVGGEHSKVCLSGTETRSMAGLFSFMSLVCQDGEISAVETKRGEAEISGSFTKAAGTLL